MPDMSHIYLFHLTGPNNFKLTVETHLCMEFLLDMGALRVMSLAPWGYANRLARGGLS